MTGAPHAFADVLRLAQELLAAGDVEAAAGLVDDAARLAPLVGAEEAAACTALLQDLTARFQEASRAAVTEQGESETTRRGSREYGRVLAGARP